LVPIYIVTILTLFLNNQSLAARIGNNYEQQMPVPGVKAPSVRIESLNKINPGETVDLTAYATVDTKHNGEAFFYWYADQGTFTLHPSYPDYSTVTYTAPNTPGDVTITAQVGDTLGYVGTDRFTITVLGATNGKGNPPVLQKCTYRVSPKDWQDVYHATYRLTVAENADGVPVGHISIQPTTGDMRWNYSGTVRTLVNGTAVNIYRDAGLTDLIGKAETYHNGYDGIDIYFNAGFSENKDISVEQREDRYGKWLVDWRLQSSCPGPGKHNNGTPDLIVDTAEAEPDTQLEPGASTFIRARVSNIGDGPADASAFACYISSDSSWDSSDTLLYRKEFSILYDGRNAFVEQNVNIPASLSSGDYYLVFRADDQGTVAETDERNNEAAVRIEVKTGADLTVSNTGVSPTNVTPGQAVTLNARVTNSGGTGTLASSSLGYYLSADANWDSADTLLGTSSFGSLLPGQSQDFSRSFILPADLPTGQQYIIFYADYADKVTETDNGNNQASVSLQVSYNQTMTVLTPNASTSWSYDRQQTIQWASNFGGTVKIDLYKSLSFNRTIATDASNTGTFTWSVPELQPEDHYWIRITSNTNSSVSDDSERFTITNPATLTVLSPGDGDVFGFGSTRNITWDSSFDGTVDIDLYKAGAFYRIIDRSVPTVRSSDDSYAWSVPSDLAEGTDYQVKVTHSSDPSTTDRSDGYFTIADPSTEDPLAVDDAAVTEEDIAVIIAVLANDNPPQGETLEVTDVSDPANGTVLINGDNTITYTPNSGFTGSDAFTYTVTSPSRGTASAAVYVTVNEIVSCDPWELPPEILALARDDAGNIFAVGTFHDSITLGTDAPVTLTAPAETYALYIAKYTSSGTLLWAQKTVATSFGVMSCKAAVDTTGNLYISGDYYKAMNFYNGESVAATLYDPSTEYDCGYEVFLAKYSPAGEPVWAERAGGKYSDHGESLAVDSATARLYIGGIFDGVLDLGSGASTTTLNSADDNVDPFLAQYTLDGTLLWAKQINGGSGSVLSVAAKGTDAVLATGYYYDTITLNGSSPITLTSGSGSSQFIAEFSATNGQVRWAQKANGTSSCMGRAVAADDAGQVYVAGDFRETCDFYDTHTLFESLTSFGANDMFMIKYQADGTPEWLHQGGGTSYDFGRHVTFDQDSNPLFIGTCGQFPVDFSIDGAGTTAASSTSCAATYDIDGNFLEFVEPGNNVVTAEESSGNSVIIGTDGTVSPCTW
jgi:hypothetical protein